MSYAASTTPTVTRVTNGPGLEVTRAQSWFATSIKTLALWQNRASQRHNLRVIEDRLLADMGITRADAEHESRKPFWQA